MNILLTNDDGFNSRGIAELSSALTEAGASVYVLAPEAEQSGASQKVSMRKGLYVRRLSPEEKSAPSVDFDKNPGPSLESATAAFAINGTPADCVKLGLHYLELQGITVDAVFSGINCGANLGRDVWYSGTVGAAREGALSGVRSCAVSITSRHPKDYEYAKKLALLALRGILPGLATAETFININIPNLPAEELQGVRFCVLGPRIYDGEFAEGPDEEGRHCYWYSGVPHKYPELGLSTDVVASDAGFVTISPIHTDVTDYEILRKLKRAFGAGEREADAEEESFALSIRSAMAVTVL